MKTLIPFTVCLSSLLSLNLCGAATPGDYTVNIAPHSAEATIGEPVFVASTFSNLTAEPVSLIWVSGAPGYEGFAAKGTVQVSTNGTAFEDVSAFERSGGLILPHEVPARGSLTQVFTLLSDKNGSLLCPTPGDYWVRARMKVLKDDETYWLLSETARFTVAAPTNEDLVVWKLLETDPVYLDLVRAPGSVKLSETDLKRFGDIVQSHGHSVYAPCIALSLGRQAFEVRNESRPIDLPRAKAYLNTALMLTNSEMVRKLALAGLEDIQRLEDWRLQKQKEAPKPLVTNLIYKATKELEAQWYDVKGFMRSTNPVARQFRSKMIELSWKYRHSDMPGAEFDRTYADLLREAIKKNLTPLEPDEWRRRYAAYAKEDEARAKAEAEQWRRSKELDRNAQRIPPAPGPVKK